MRLPAFEIERYFAPYEFSTPHMLSGSDCESLSIAQLCELVPGAADELFQQRLGYTTTEGDPALRDAIADLYTSVDAAGVLVHSGAGEAIFTAMEALLEPGDEIVVHYPCYQSLHEVARSIGATIVPWEVSAETGWALDPDRLEVLVTARTRAVVINVPHNPSGWLADASTFRAIVDCARRHDLVLVCDEVYRGLEHDPADLLPAACDEYENAISIGVMSKSYGLPGLRIGWLASRRLDLLERAKQTKDYTTLCCSAPSEKLATIALQVGPLILERNRRLVLDNLVAVDDLLARHAERLAWHRPRAGAIGFPRLLAGDLDEFCRAARIDAGVLLLPGTVYEPESTHFRLGFGRADTRAGLERFDAFLSRP